MNRKLKKGDFVTLNLKHTDTYDGAVYLITEVIKPFLGLTDQYYKIQPRIKGKVFEQAYATEALIYHDIKFKVGDCVFAKGMSIHSQQIEDFDIKDGKVYATLKGVNGIPNPVSFSLPISELTYSLSEPDKQDKKEETPPPKKGDWVYVYQKSNKINKRKRIFLADLGEDLKERYVCVDLGDENKFHQGEPVNHCNWDCLEIITTQSATLIKQDGTQLSVHGLSNESINKIEDLMKEEGITQW